MTDNPNDAWVEIDRFTARADAEPYALVLAAVGINCRLVAVDGAVALSAASPDATRARHEVASYVQENQRQSRSSHPTRALIEGVGSALAYGVVLLFLYGASRRGAFSQDWWSAGAAQAGLIADGEWWRTLTALGLHADLGHLASNLAFGSFLGLLLAQLGAPSRINYTIIGDTVNTAQRLEELSRRSEEEVSIVVGGETAQHLSSEFRLASLGRQVLRGRHEELEVFRLQIPNKAPDST